MLRGLKEKTHVQNLHIIQEGLFVLKGQNLKRRSHLIVQIKKSQLLMKSSFLSILINDSKTQKYYGMLQNKLRKEMILKYVLKKSWRLLMIKKFHWKIE